MNEHKLYNLAFWIWQYLKRCLIWHWSQSSIRPSIHFILIVKSRSNLFMVLSNKGSFLLKETTGTPTNDLHVTSQTFNPLYYLYITANLCI